MEVYRNYPNNPDIIMELIRVYELSKQYDKEIELLQEVLQRYPDATVLQDRLNAVKQLKSEN